ncbi:MAG: hypothetical protein AAGE85_08785 [Pseudomonadota bacterium]
MRRSFEQRNAQLVLQLGDGFADCLLCDIARGCGKAEVAVLVDTQKMLQFLWIYGLRHKSLTPYVGFFALRHRRDSTA